MKQHHYFISYKPYGFISQVKLEGYKKRQRGLSELYSFPEGVHPVGRLDEDSEGLLLLTSDNKLNIHIRSTKIEKEYWVQLDGEIDELAVEKLKQGVEITVDKMQYLTKPCACTKLNEEPLLPERNPPSRAGRHRPYSWISIVLTEGKFRQVRKMTAAAGFPTMRLVRVRIGNIKLGDMQPGEVKMVDEFLL